MLTFSQLEELKERDANLVLTDVGWHVEIFEIGMGSLGIARYSEVLEIFGRYQ